MLYLLMPCRWENLQRVYQGFLKSQIPLIEWSADTFIPFQGGDDCGIYLYIPKIAYYFNIPLETATNLFFTCLYWLPLLTSFIGFFILYNTLQQRIYTCISFVLLHISIYNLSDVYLAYSAPLLITIPWTLWFFSKKEKGLLIRLLLYYFACGNLFVFFHLIRSYSWMPALCFIIPFIAMHKNKRILNGIFLLVGVLCSWSVYRYQQYQHNTFIKATCPCVKPKTYRHPLWHTIYLSFGFIKPLNVDDITYDDRHASSLAQKHLPTVQPYDPEYEKFFKKKTLNLFKEHTLFVIYTISAKIGILLFFLLLYAHVGLISMCFFPLNTTVFLAFIVALGGSMIFPLISMPTSRVCSLSFIVTSWLLGLTSVNNALYLYKKYKKRLK